MANVVGGAEVAGFYDHSLYEETKRGSVAIRREILKQLDGTSVTVVLIGTHTAARSWVDVEIRESVKRGNGLLGITIHHLNAPPWPGAPATLWGPSQPGNWPPALPAGTPVYAWDPKKREGLARVIDEAARRGEQLKATMAEAQRRALLSGPPLSRYAPAPPPSIIEMIRRQQQAERIARLLAPPPPPPQPTPDSFDIAALLRTYRMRR